MKKLITIFSFAICFFFVGSLHAQTSTPIPNGNFSDWPGTKLTPTRWSTISLIIPQASGTPAPYGMVDGAKEGNTAPFYKFFPKTAGSHNTTDGSKAAAITTDTGSTNEAYQIKLFGKIVKNKLFPTMLFTGDFAVDYSKDSADKYYQTFYTAFRQGNFLKLIVNYAEDFFPYIQNKPKITGQAPTIVEGFFQYEAADWDRDSRTDSLKGDDRPAMWAFTVKDSSWTENGTTKAYSRVASLGSFKLDSSLTTDWTKFTIELKDLDKTIKPTHFLVFFMPSGDSATMIKAFENRTASNQRSKLTIDDVTCNGVLDVNLNFNNYPSGLEFEVVPSLSNGQVTVNLPTETADITIYNTQGKVVLKKTCKNGETLNIDNSGAYLVKAVAKGQQGIRKISVVK